LSGQCYPLKSIDSIKKVLYGKNLAYMEFFKIPEPRWGKQKGLDRLEYQYFENPFSILYDILLKKMLGTSEHAKRRFMKLPRINRRIPYSLEPYGGSMWFCLTKKHVDYILEYLKDKPALLDFFKRTLVPDKLLFQTIIMNSP